MLIVEGPDCVGKTTVVNALCKILDEDCNFPALPQHFGLLPKSWNYKWGYNGFVNSHVVMDRFALSEIVYGHALRDGTKLSPGVWNNLRERFRRANVMTLWIRCSKQTDYKQLLQEQIARVQHFNPEQLARVNEHWEMAFAHGGPYANYGDLLSPADFVWDVTVSVDGFNWVPESLLKVIAQNYYEIWASFF